MNVPSFVPGATVLVIDGLSKGLRGKIVARAHNHGAMPAYRIDLGGLLRDRIIRADFLKLEEAQS